MRKLYAPLAALGLALGLALAALPGASPGLALASAAGNPLGGITAHHATAASFRWGCHGHPHGHAYGHCRHHHYIVYPGYPNLPA